jgi:hypothetical protein
MRALTVLGATDAADEMVGDLRHRHAPWQAEAPGIEIKVALWTA